MSQSVVYSNVEQCCLPPVAMHSVTLHVSNSNGCRKVILFGFCFVASLRFRQDPKVAKCRAYVKLERAMLE
jgi:hypothetical protein